MQKESIFIFAGEKSGDMHGSFLMKEIKKMIPNCYMDGVGGPKMRQEGLLPILQMEDFEVMGFSDVFLSLPKLLRQFYTIRRHILKANPKAVILVDYPGFNLRMARALRQVGYQGKLIQYVSPTVWAWGRKRIDQMAATLDLLLTIYPFERKCYTHTSLPVEYVGNPLQEYIRTHHYRENWHVPYGIPSTENLIALFPGSRLSEVKDNLPFQLEAAVLMKKKYPETIFALSHAHEKAYGIIKELIQSTPLKLDKDIFIVPKEITYDLMKSCRCAMAKSGTVTLELALHQKPSVVHYKVTRINRFFAEHILRLNLPYYCIVNILADKEIFPELIAYGLSAENLYYQLESLYRDGEARNTCISQCQVLQETLCDYNASEKAAEAIVKVLSC